MERLGGREPPSERQQRASNGALSVTARADVARSPSPTTDLGRAFFVTALADVRSNAPLDASDVKRARAACKAARKSPNSSFSRPPRTPLHSTACQALA